MADTIATWHRNKFIQIKDPRLIESRNFKIQSHHGRYDWSPYLTWPEAQERIQQMNMEYGTGNPRDDSYFILVED